MQFCLRKGNLEGCNLRGMIGVFSPHKAISKFHKTALGAELNIPHNIQEKAQTGNATQNLHTSRIQKTRICHIHNK